ncbi:MAG TPA: alpha/beta fold hydrolase [Longimicrobiales bacterium]|nr:alpha/beta fold hydrolase [Longimicrobiales bacterium]
MSTTWLIRQKPRPDAVIRLFCFPHAGVGASAYRAWATALPEDIELCAVQPPGRESRLREPPYTSVDALVAGAFDALLPELEPPFAFFGHSMGATVAFELARRLAESGRPSPVWLFVSGRRGPRLPDPDPPLRELSDTAFVDRILARYGGIPDEILRHRDLLELLLPGLRADIAALETHKYRPGELLGCPITAFGGTSDDRARPVELAAWRTETTGPFDLKFFPGDHFYLEHARGAVIDAICARLRNRVRHTPAWQLRTAVDRERVEA